MSGKITDNTLSNVELQCERIRKHEPFHVFGPSSVGQSREDGSSWCRDRQHTPDFEEYRLLHTEAGQTVLPRQCWPVEKHRNVMRCMSSGV